MKTISKAAASRALARGAKQKTTQAKPATEKPPVDHSGEVAGSIKKMVDDLSAIMADHLARFDQVTAELRTENKEMKRELLAVTEEVKALRNRSVRLKPKRDSNGEYEHIDVIPIKKKEPIKNLN
jgi:hypothetical protein